MGRTGPRKVVEIPKDDDAPKIIKGCKFWKLYRCQVSDSTFPVQCGKCAGCSQHKHESLVSRGLAEAQSAACTLFVTLTYEDDDKGEILDKDDIKKFQDRLRKDCRFRALTAGEYGTTKGRAHWHCLLYFQWDEQHLEQWKEEQIQIDRRGQYDGDSWHGKRCAEWKNYCPKMRMGRIRDKRAFMAALADPESLWVDTIGHKNAGEYPQRWRYWPWGNVEARIVSAPNVASEQEQNKAVRYAVKYASKDCWKDGKLRHKPFDELPEWVKQGTAYGPWDESGGERTKWVRGNHYVKELEKRLLSEFSSDADVPLHRQIKRHKYMYRPKGGLGRDYFECLGAWYARRAGSQEELVNRLFKLGPSYKTRKQRVEFYRDGVNHSQIEDVIRNAQKPSPIQARNQFYMSDTAYRQFAKGFNNYLLSQGKAETTGPDHIFDNLDTKAQRSADNSSGELGLWLWEKDWGTPKRNKQQRQKLEKLWATKTVDEMRGYVPQRLQRMLEDTSTEQGWIEKRKQREFAEEFGKPRCVYQFEKYRILETKQKRFFLEKNADGTEKAVQWYFVELQTLQQLETAVTGNIPRQSERETSDHKRLSEYDIRTIRKRLV